MSYKSGLNLVNGAMNGFQFMDNYMDKEEDRAIAAEEREYQQKQREGLELQKQKGLALNAVNQGMKDGYITEDAATAFNKHYPDSNLFADISTEDLGSITERLLTSGEFSEESAAMANEWAKRSDINFEDLLDPSYGEALSVLEQTVTGQVKRNSPEFKQAFNRIFQTEINKGVGERFGNKTIKEKIVQGVYPSPDGQNLMLDLGITEEDELGNVTFRNAPVTDGRSASDDGVKTVSLEGALGNLKGKQLMFGAIQADPKMQAIIRQLAQLNGTPLPAVSKKYGKIEDRPGLGYVQFDSDGKAQVLKEHAAPKAQYGKPFKHPDYGWVQKGPDGKLSPVSSAKSRNANKAPADVQMAEWMVSKGIAPDLDVALNRISESRTDPGRFVMDYVEQELGFQEASGIYPGEDGYKTPADLRYEAAEALKTIRAQTRGVKTKSDAKTGLNVVDDVVQDNASNQSDEKKGLTVPKHKAPDVPDGQSGPIQRPNGRVPPQEALDALAKNPALAEQFYEYYGYLPQGYNL
jgi:hypothetical protein